MQSCECSGLVFLFIRKVQMKRDTFGIEIIDEYLDHYDMCHPVHNTINMSANEIRTALYKAKAFTDGMAVEVSNNVDTK